MANSKSNSKDISSLHAYLEKIKLLKKRIQELEEENQKLSNTSLAKTVIIAGKSTDDENVSLTPMNINNKNPFYRIRKIEKGKDVFVFEMTPAYFESISEDTQNENQEEIESV